MFKEAAETSLSKRSRGFDKEVLRSVNFLLNVLKVDSS